VVGDVAGAAGGGRDGGGGHGVRPRFIGLAGTDCPSTAEHKSRALCRLIRRRSGAFVFDFELHDYANL
jgi:hypothetical protein